MEFAMVRRGIVALASCIATGFAPDLDAEEPSPGTRVASALTQMHAWVGEGENGQRWREYLMSDRVEEQLARGGDADPQALAAPLARYYSRAKGLDRPRFVEVRTALANWQRALAGDQESDLEELAREAGERFVPISPAQVASARRILLENVRRLDAFLEGSGAKELGWKEYLLWNRLQAQLAREDAPDIGVLAQVYRRFRAVHAGLELPVFADVADALERYVQFANIARQESQSRIYVRQLDALAEELESYVREPSGELALSIGQRLGFVDALGQSPRLVRAVRRRFAKPNLRARVSSDLLAAAVTQEVRDTRNVTDVILGTYLSGPATTDARLSARTVSADGAARIQLSLRGMVTSDTVGRNGPVRIFSSAETPFQSFKTVLFDRNGFREQAACTSATTCSDIHCIRPVKSGIGSGLIEKIAWKRAVRQKGQAEAIAADHAEIRISRSFNDRMLNLLSEAQANYNRDLRLPLIRRKEFPEYFDVGSTSEGLAITVLQATRSQLGATTSPPDPQGDYDLSVAVHESLPNNLANSWLSGYRLTDDWLRERIRERGGEVPPELQEDREPWSILFASQRPPVSVRFDDGAFAVTIRGLEFTSGENAYGAMNITAQYRFESTAQGVLMRRQGELEILPPDFDPDTDRLTADQSALRKVLNERLGEVLKPEIRGEGIELPGELVRAGKLLPVEATSDAGWLRMGWNRTRERTVVATLSEIAGPLRSVSNPE